MAGMGPPPKPAAERRRRNATPAARLLPAGGRRGRTPVWPLMGRPSRRESVVWRQMWRKPQAVAWEQLGCTHDVAIYVRYLVQGELGSIDALKEARQWSDRLGLTPQAMLRLRWEIAPDEVGQAREQRAAKAAPAPETAGGAARKRLRVVGEA